MELTPTLILNLALLIVPPVALVLVFRQWLARHIRWSVALTALCDVLLFWDELFYYESFSFYNLLHSCIFYAKSNIIEKCIIKKNGFLIHITDQTS